MGASGSKEGTAPDKVDVRDYHAVKATLDDYSVELLKKAGYSIDHRLDDMRMGMAAQFWGKSEYWTFMPELRDKPIVLVPCVLGYFGLSGLLWWIESYSMKNTIAIVTSSPGLPGLRLYSSMKFPDDHYTLKLTMGQKESVRKEYVGKLFDEDGEIQLKALSVMVNDLVHEMDEPSESSNGDSKKDQ